MNDDSFEALEALVERAVEALTRLRQERDVLRREVEALEARVAESESRPAASSDEGDLLGRLSAERAAVRERLQGLLQRLEEVEHAE